MAVVLLVRHGQAGFSGAYGGLTELGRAQAAAAGTAVVGRVHRVATLMTGSLARQEETACICRDAFGDNAPPYRTDERWDEYDWQALLDAFPNEVAPPEPAVDARAFQAALDESMARWIDSDSGGAGLAPWREFRDAARAGLDDTFGALRGGETGVVVSSAGRIVAACADVLGLSRTATVAMHRVMLNGSITKLIRGRTGTSVVSVNEHAHLEMLGRDHLTYR